MRPRTWTFAWADAQELAGDELLEPGDELGLRWLGEWSRPELVARGEGRRAIVVAITRDTGAGLPVGVQLALVEEGADASPVDAGDARPVA